MRTRRAAQPGQQRRARAAVKVDREVVALARAAGGRARGRPSRPRSAARARRDDDLVEMRVAGDDRRGRGLDEIGELRVGKPPAQRVNGRRREDDVADLAQANEQDCNCRSISQFSRHSSIVASSISMTGMSSLIGYTRLHVRALERGAVLDERHRRLAVRTGENLEQFRVDGHAREYMTPPAFCGTIQAYEARSPRRGVQRVASARGARARSGARGQRPRRQRPRRPTRSAEAYAQFLLGHRLEERRRRERRDRGLQARDGARSAGGRHSRASSPASTCDRTRCRKRWRRPNRR